jgi:hypothetical protein
MIAATTDPLPGGGGYLAAAYLVLTALLLIYFALMAIRLSRLERDVVSLHELLDERDENKGQGTDG